MATEFNPYAAAAAASAAAAAATALSTKEDRLEEFKRYKVKHGDSTCFTAEREAALNDLGSMFRSPRAGTPPGRPTFQNRMHRARWEERLKELKEFSEQNGHGNVPYNYPPNPTLSKFVERQRESYRQMKKGKHSTLTEEKMAELAEAGLDLATCRSFTPRLNDNWRKRLEEVKEYKEKNGHLNISRKNSSNPHLARWVQRQRRLYHSKMKGNPNTLTDERIVELVEAGVILADSSRYKPGQKKRKTEEGDDDEKNEGGKNSISEKNERNAKKGRKGAGAESDAVDHENLEEKDPSSSSSLVDHITCVACSHLLVRSVAAHPCGHFMCESCARGLVDDHRRSNNNHRPDDRSTLATLMSFAKCPRCCADVAAWTPTSSMDGIVWLACLDGKVHHKEIARYLNRSGRKPSAEERRLILPKYRISTEGVEATSMAGEASVAESTGHCSAVAKEVV